MFLTQSYHMASEECNIVLKHDINSDFVSFWSFRALMCGHIK